MCRAVSRVLVPWFAMVLSLSFAHAQFFDRLTNPEVVVNISHPPNLGLKIDRIAFGPTSGQCADDIVSATISSFVSNDIEVIDRHHLNSLLAEHDFSLSGYVDQTTAAEIGKILGPTALVFIRVQRCVTEQDRLSERESRYSEKRGNYTVIKHIARTRTFLKGSMQTVDLATGRIFAAKTFEFSPEAKNESYEGRPEFPSKYDVLDTALGASALYIKRMFVPWTERRKLVYYNNKKCNLKDSYMLMKAGDYAGALRLSEQSLADCKSNPKTKEKLLGKAYYNVGIGHFIQNDYQKANEYFLKAFQRKVGKIASEAMASAQRAQELRLEMLKIDERAEVAAEQRAAAEKAADEAERAEAAKKMSAAMSNADVIELAEKGLPAKLIISKIRNSETDFDTSTDALIELTASGVPEDIIALMIEIGS